MSYCKKCYVDSKKAGIIEEKSYWNIGYGYVLDDSDMKNVIKGIPSLKDSKYLSFEMIRGKSDKEIQRMII